MQRTMQAARPALARMTAGYAEGALRRSGACRCVLALGDLRAVLHRAAAAKQRVSYRAAAKRRALRSAAAKQRMLHSAAILHRAAAAKQHVSYCAAAKRRTLHSAAARRAALFRAGADPGRRVPPPNK